MHTIPPLGTHAPWMGLCERPLNVTVVSMLFSWKGPEGRTLIDYGSAAKGRVIGNRFSRNRFSKMDMNWILLDTTTITIYIYILVVVVVIVLG